MTTSKTTIRIRQREIVASLGGGSKWTGSEWQVLKGNKIIARCRTEEEAWKRISKLSIRVGADGKPFVEV